MLAKIKLLLGITTSDKDTLLNLLIENATNEAMLYTHNENVEVLENAIVQMCVYNYNRLGSEGVDSENYSGVSYNYSADYPENVMRMLKSKRKVIVV